MDRQNRVGSKFGGGGIASVSRRDLDRKDRLRRLAMEAVDLTKDPYFSKNSVGTVDCSLCCTVHTNEGNYIAHTQGRRHQTNLLRRANRAAKRGGVDEVQASLTTTTKANASRGAMKIGRPAYKAAKLATKDGRRGLRFVLSFPDIDPGTQPRHRIMSAFEQKKEPIDRKFQYVVIAASPYESIGFKIPSKPLDRSKMDFDWKDNEFKLTVWFADKTTT